MVTVAAGPEDGVFVPVVLGFGVTGVGFGGGCPVVEEPEPGEGATGFTPLWALAPLATKSVAITTMNSFIETHLTVGCIFPYFN
jgi:hypothetical protein